MKYLIVYMLLPFLMQSCEDTLRLSPCLNDRIMAIDANPCDTTAQILEYWFQGENVFYIDPGHCADDQSYEVIDENCEVLGHLLGFTGNQKINGVNFYENAQLVRVVWAK